MSLLAPLSACQSTKEVKITTVETTVKTQKQPAPREIKPKPVKFVVITPANIDSYLEKIKTGNITMIGLTKTDYQNMMNNQYEMRRYIEQQKSIIVYYEGNL